MTAGLVFLLLAGGPISVDHRGTLGEALNAIASKGGINLIATGELNVPAEVHFKGLSAEEALEALAKVHKLEIHKEGKLWVVKPAEAGAAVVLTQTPAADLPPIPALPPLTPLPPNATPEQIEAAAVAAQERARQAEQRAEELREKAEALREAKENEADARNEEDEARIDEARAAIEAAKEAARDAHHEQKHVSTGPVVIADGEHVEDVISYGGSVTLGDGVLADGDVVAFGGDVVMGDGVMVNGDAVSFGGTVKKGDGSLVKGEEVAFGSNGFGVKVAKAAIPALKVNNEEVSSHHPSGIAAFLINFATFFGLGFLLMMFAPNRMRNIEAEIRHEPVKSGLAGFLALLSVLPLSALLALTIIGIPFMFLGWLLGGLAMLMGLLAFANLLGSRIPVARLRRTQAVVLAVGLLAIMLVTLVPVVGPITLMVALCISFGAMIRTRVGQRALGMPIPEPQLASADRL